MHQLIDSLQTRSFHRFEAKLQQSICINQQRGIAMAMVTISGEV